ncbi:MAG: YqjF family protein [Gaiellaceae bacterium]
MRPSSASRRSAAISSALQDLIRAPERQTASLGDTAHRPWPLPQGPWLQGQTWDELLFAHWRVEPDELFPLLPEQVALDLHEDEAWLGITPFRITGLRLHGLPPIPVLSSFPEVNVRTYVSHEGKPGIWFFSLDADSPWAVEAARLVYRLPYHRARVEVSRRGDWIDYASSRDGASLDLSYRPTGPVVPPQPGTVEHFLTERYCLYTEDDGRLYRADIHHLPWPLQTAEAEVRETTIAPVTLEGEPLLHYSERQDVVIWPLERV